MAITTDEQQGVPASSATEDQKPPGSPAPALDNPANEAMPELFPTATAARKALEVLMKEIAAQRRELQFAMDGLWPAGNPENAAIRVEFQLSADRASKG